MGGSRTKNHEPWQGCLATGGFNYIFLSSRKGIVQGNDDYFVVIASEVTHIGEVASQGALGAWLKQLWKWGSGNWKWGSGNGGGGGLQALALSSLFFDPPFSPLYRNSA